MEVRPPAFISVQDYADYRGVHRNTVIKWIRLGRCPAEQPAGKYGRYAIPAQMIDKHQWPPAPGWPERPI